MYPGYRFNLHLYEVITPMTTTKKVPAKKTAVKAHNRAKPVAKKRSRKSKQTLLSKVLTFLFGN